MKKDAFHLLYKKLNTSQKKAVDTIEGPVMVIAGPGTGKTTVLTLRIANILQKTDIAPEQILALTFTESGVYSMREGLVKLIGSRAYRVRIATFHGFCNDVIQTYPEYFDTIIGGMHLTPVEQIGVIEEIISALPLTVLKPAGNQFHNVMPLLSQISATKREGFSPQEVEEKINNFFPKRKKTSSKKKLGYKEFEAEKKEKKAREFLRVYTAYTTYLREKKQYDYDDMIMEVLAALARHVDLLRTLQEEYQYILADEHQDVNGAQNKVLELLASFHEPYPNLFIVGDEKQAIFRFQGASLENFLYFKKRYPKALLISLTENYRSPQFVLDAAHSLIAHGGATGKELRIPLRAARAKEKGAIQIFSFPREHDERIFLAEKIQTMIARGVPPAEIAVLFRDNKDAAPLAAALEDLDIPFTVYTDENILEDPLLVRLLTLLRGIYNLNDDAHVAALLLLDFLGIDPVDAYTLFEEAQKKRIPIIQLLRSSKELGETSLTHKKNIQTLAEHLLRWKSRAENETFATLLHEVAHESGFINFLLARPDAPYVLDKLHALYNEAQENSFRRPAYKLVDFLREVSVRELYGVALKKRGQAIFTESVQLMTVHRSKGLEFSYVFVVGATDKKWGGRRIPHALSLPFLESAEEKEDDERRLFYVAATRAKKELIVTHAEQDADGKMLLPSRFIEEIDKEFRTHEKRKPIKKESLLHVPRKLSSRIPRMERAYLTQRFTGQSFSITALNNYLACPWKYFYINLLRIPQLQKPHQMYGIAVHEALRVLFENLSRGVPVSQKIVTHAFIEALKRFSLSESVYKRYQEKGVKALRAYYAEYKNAWNKSVVLEYKITGTLPNLPMRLSGTLDKIEILDQENRVNVVDYKTGTQKTRNELEGKTKNGTGNEKRQLIFYKVLLDNFRKKEFSFVSGELDFIEPNERGVFRKEKFFISEEETEALITLLQETAQNILSFSFWNATCEEKGCEYCALRKRAGAKLIDSSQLL